MYRVVVECELAIAFIRYYQCTNEIVADMTEACACNYTETHDKQVNAEDKLSARGH